MVDIFFRPWCVDAYLSIRSYETDTYRIYLKLEKFSFEELLLNSEGCCNLWYPSKMFLQLKYHKLLFPITYFFCQIILKSCTEDGNNVAMLCEKFQNNFTAKMDVVAEWDFSAFEFWLISPLCRIYASVNWVSIGSDNGLSPIRLQAII